MDSNYHLQTMPDFQDAKIYKLTTKKHELCYIGSTTEKNLKQRLYKHRAAYNQHLKNNYRHNSSFKLIELGPKDVGITLLEAFPCANRQELLEREGSWVKKFKGKCVNSRTPGQKRKKKDSQCTTNWLKNTYTSFHLKHAHHRTKQPGTSHSTV